MNMDELIYEDRCIKNNWGIKLSAVFLSWERLPAAIFDAGLNLFAAGSRSHKPIN
jgi:hypothetical protein